ncbi:Adenosine deaminase-like protein [Orchesella cincta]|uniref:Adenosine deaminase-like protein n=1 Tax=Orchesella cincta TaxID=48709 RepID=A0A1D2MVT6_ORCCI|nr:Adenosine deaminase-like protein [Orchesella cincta]
MQASMDKVIRAMPKVELHAHLNGSISDKLLEHIKTISDCSDGYEPDVFPSIDSNGVLLDPINHSLDAVNDDKQSDTRRSLKECWNAFAKIHEVIQTPQDLYVATINVIAEFSKDNVIYLELRTGPKKVHNIPSKLSYIESVVKGITDAQNRFPIVVKLLISVDRKNGEQEALETVELSAIVAAKYPDIVVGIDVSGDPNYGNSTWIVNVMGEARRKGFKISCHLPEIVNPDEAIAFLEFGPERLGHGQFLHPLYGGTTELWELTKRKRIPVESCISSNIVSGVAVSVEDHIVKIFQKESLPYFICTDDMGVFRTTLSNEFRKLLTVVELSFQQIRNLCLDAVEHSFASTVEKERLTTIIQKWWLDVDCKSQGY